MKDLISELYSYICNSTPAIQNDPEYQQAFDKFAALEAAVQEKAGDDLLYQYQCAEADLLHRQHLAYLVQTLRLCHQFYLAVRP